MAGKSLTVEEILTLLAEMPPRIAALTTGLTPDQLRATPNYGGWSAVDLLAHLRSCADVWGKCIGEILAQDNPTLRAINPWTWVKQTDYPELEFQPSFHAYAAQRTEQLAVLEPLAPEDWLRTATVTGAGKPLVRTVFFYAQWMAVHERTHIRQFKGIVNAVQM